jgi:quercetin dioxygenase-like cupin family protein
MRKGEQQMEKCKVNFDSLPWQSSLKGARYKAFQQGSRKLRLLEFSQGFIEPDWCTKGHIGYVLDGELDIDFNGSLVRFSAGDGVFIPAGTENKHKAKVLTDVVRLILVEEA